MDENQEFSLLQLTPSNLFVLASDSTPVAIAKSVEDAKRWVYENDPLHDPVTWIHIPEGFSQQEKWVSINKIGRMHTIYATKMIT